METSYQFKMSIPNYKRVVILKENKFWSPNNGHTFWINIIYK